MGPKNYAGRGIKKSPASLRIKAADGRFRSAAARQRLISMRDITKTSLPCRLRYRTRRKARNLDVRIDGGRIENGLRHQGHVRIVDVVKIRPVNTRNQVLLCGRRISHHGTSGHRSEIHVEKR